VRDISSFRPLLSLALLAAGCLALGLLRGGAAPPAPQPPGLRAPEGLATPPPAPVGAPADFAAAAAAAPAPAVVRLNAATRAELESLPGIGPALAGRILEFRAAHGPFRHASELLLVRGIGPKKWAALRALVAP